MKPEQAAMLGYGNRVRVDPKYHPRPGQMVRGEVTVFDCKPDSRAMGRYTAIVADQDGRHVPIDAHWLEYAR